MAWAITLQRAAQGMAQRRFERRVGILLLHQLVHAQRFADDLIRREVAARLHLPENKFLLMGRQRNFHELNIPPP